MAPRERQRAKSSKTSNAEYVVLIAGVPPNCRWQELKDYVGQLGAPHRREAQIYLDEKGNPTGKGSVIIRDLDEGLKVYNELSRRGWNGHPLKVVLSQRVAGELVPVEGATTSPNVPSCVPNATTHATISRQVSLVSPPVSPRSNRRPGYSSAVDPRAAYYATSGVYQSMLTAGQTAEAPGFVAARHNTALPSPAHAQYQTVYYADVDTVAYQNAPFDTIASTYANGNRPTATHMSRHTASRAQATRGPSATIVSPNRSIFLSKLPYNAVEQAVRRLLEPFGRVEGCDVPLDRTSPSKIQGIATARFRETNDAARAIRDLNGKTWRGVTISVRWDKNAASTSSTDFSSGRSGQARHSSSGAGRTTNASRDDNGARDQRRRAVEGPLIVNGSRGNVAPSHNRRGSREDDSDSSDTDEETEGGSSSDDDARSVARRTGGRRH